ncbi:hypothetical protein BDY19DRAFT_995567 [Irpex rosettiformis]|uniref:Uncharacterized protein n=1 Tax=Irpex rosettiformis TaxID=378272 RepID=A0ACB8TXX2_9APHY|nr:hypothetical protein BDY19DRAFT_995567 [Irpex rosettiformis]
MFGIVSMTGDLFRFQSQNIQIQDLTDLYLYSEIHYYADSRSTVGAPPTPHSFFVFVLTVFQLVNILKAPRQTNYSTRALFEMMERDVINLDPQYQRDVVWSEEKQVALIGSIFVNIAVPPVMFSSSQSGWNEEKTCMDGKQRLTSIRKFINGEIYFRHPDTGKRLWYTKSPKGRRVVLSINQRQVFDNKQITCIEYESLSEEQQREIFQRVQNGVALTPAERLRATSGPRADLVRQVLRDVIKNNEFFHSFGWGKGADFHTLSFSMWLFDNYSTPPKIVGIPALEKWLQEHHMIKEDVRQAILETFQIVKVLADESDFRSCFHKISQIPFTFAALLIYRYRNRLSLTQLVSAITGLRESLGRGQGEQRANLKTVKALNQYIKSLCSKPPAGDAQDSTPAVEGVKAYVRSSSSRELPPMPKQLKVITKRKREDTDTDDSDDKPLTKRKSTSRLHTKSESSSAPAPSTSKQPAARTPPVSANVPTKSQPANKRTPLSSMPKIPKKSSIGEPSASPATTRVKRKSLQPVAIPDIQMQTSRPLKFVIPTSLPDIESENEVSVPQHPPGDARPPSQPVRNGDPGLSRPPPTKPASDRLKSMRQAMARAELSNYTLRTSPGYGSPERSPVVSAPSTSVTHPTHPVPGTQAHVERPMEDSPFARGPSSDPRRRHVIKDTPIISEYFPGVQGLRMVSTTSAVPPHAFPISATISPDTPSSAHARTQQHPPTSPFERQPPLP